MRCECRIIAEPKPCKASYDKYIAVFYQSGFRRHVQVINFRQLIPVKKNAINIFFEAFKRSEIDIRNYFFLNSVFDKCFKLFYSLSCRIYLEAFQDSVPSHKWNIKSEIFDELLVEDST